MEKLSDVEYWVCYVTIIQSQGLKLSRTLIYLFTFSFCCGFLSELPFFFFFFLSFDCQKKKKRTEDTKNKNAAQLIHRVNLKKPSTSAVCLISVQGTLLSILTWKKGCCDSRSWRLTGSYKQVISNFTEHFNLH